jgi:hypothetical protein
LQNVVIPLAVGTVAQVAFGLPDLVGYALTFATVVTINGREILQHRRINPIAAGTLLNVVLSAVLVLVGVQSPLAHQAVFSAMLAVATLGSFIFGPRPLSFYLGRQLVANADDLAGARYDAAWQFPSARRVHRTVNAVWVVAFASQAAVAIGIPFLVHSPLVALAAPLLLVAILTATLSWTVVYVRKQERRLAATKRTTSPESSATADGIGSLQRTASRESSGTAEDRLAPGQPATLGSSW